MSYFYIESSIHSQKNLLSLNDLRKSQADKVVIVSNILYITGQYSRPLNNNWSLLNVLIMKLSDFMELEFPGLAEMSCNSFLKVCQSCKEQLVINHQMGIKEKDPIKNSLDPITWNLLANIHEKTGKLSLQNKLIYYESIGLILSAIQSNEVLVEAIKISLSKLINSWKEFLTSVDSNPDLLKKDETLLNISYFINVNEKLNSCIGSRYVIVFGKPNFTKEVIFNEMMVIYGFYTNQCKSEFATNQACLSYYSFKKMRAVKRDILKMLITFFTHVDDKHNIAKSYLPSVLNLLAMYKDDPVMLREPELLLLFGRIIETFGDFIAEVIPNILSSLFDSTLGMISSDFKSFPDHRVNFFIFLKSVVDTCFQALLNIPKEQLETIINCVIWSIKHELSSIYEVGLDSLLSLINVDSYHSRK